MTKIKEGHPSNPQFKDVRIRQPIVNGEGYIGTITPEVKG